MDNLAKLMAILSRMSLTELRVVEHFVEFLKTQQPQKEVLASLL